MYRTLDPSTGNLIKTYSLSEDRQIESTLSSASSASVVWRDLSFKERGAFFCALAVILRERKERYASLITLEMGKPIVQARAEIEKCADTCTYYAEHAGSVLAEKHLLSHRGRPTRLLYQAFGPLLGIMPWNFPFNQVFRFAVPAMMAGNVVIIKHAPNTPGCALAILEAFRDAGFPEGTFANLFITNEQVASLIADKRICGLSLTGSARAGRVLGALAGARLKKMVFELGGSDPFVVLDDSDLVQVAELAARARCANSGQVCCSSKRFLLPEKLLADFTDLLKLEFEKFLPADPRDEKTKLGPLARDDLRDNLRAQLCSAQEKGGKVLYQQKAVPEQGYYFGPMIVQGGENDSPFFVEELFGPVAVLIPYSDEKQAIDIANSSDYGLSAVVCASDTERAQRVAEKLDCGTVSINAATSSDIALPFGGVKASGFGRELGEEGLREFVSTKVIVC